ncbi:inositol 2-dehydrogenase [Komagataeibacter rhaeticus]|uniref:inositol 2-dehydrogenase n=1 Tax=Komagataeibacter rhaeticus TaxID=215221 RepID=UPI0004D7ED2C|nr:inositol 2-dehydrogenase [Komagataeibacter rhaeticus]KDU96265.1 myo-inositol 2-dehydrogenase [Komagataeibacter rhaeticus AF1]MBL7238924.1 inositol 2-dehydrogenase [Komagataeibacter rhaeticus]PYD53231.1 inositol 2-dehydrogenase [Komagataeibacter rhaeticus]GBQ12710.1 myo-inositol 2-dehydrogenase [Komagataeibacter rhaeticus DSM 16663]
MLGIGVLGCGRIGAMHATNIAAHPRARVAAVYDINPDAARAVSLATGAPVMASAAGVLAAPDVDAVLIATATDTHADLLEQAIAAGKPVLCEKPIDLSLERVDRCAAAIAGTTLPVQIGFVRRFDPGHRAVCAAVRDGTLGTLYQVIITSRDPGLPPAAYLARSGGILRDMTIHDFDMARFILDEEPTEVFATGSRLVAPALMETLGDHDTLTVVMKTASGRQAVLINAREAAYGYDQRVEAFGSRGMAVSENRRPHHMVLSGADFTDHAAPLLNFFIERYREAFDAEIDAFVDAVENGRPVAVGYNDGRQALVLAEAALKSLHEGRMVRVSEIG